jgi:hypothetical protein
VESVVVIIFFCVSLSARAVRAHLISSSDNPYSLNPIHSSLLFFFSSCILPFSLDSIFTSKVSKGRQQRRAGKEKRIRSKNGKDRA